MYNSVDEPPQLSAAILLGSAKFPKDENLETSDAFENSSVAFERYLTDKSRGLAVPPENILNLFGSSENNAAQLSALRQHLRAIMSKTEGELVNVFVYYVGHGLVDFETQELVLAIASTEAQFPSGTSLKVKELAHNLKEVARYSRRFVLLDCCFAGEAAKYFQAGPELLYKQAGAAFLDTADSHPIDNPVKGCSLLCAADKDTPAICVPGETYTRFSNALIKALREGERSARTKLTLVQVKDLVWKSLYQQTTKARPYLASPEQPDGDIASLVAIFPNPAVVRGTKGQTGPYRPSSSSDTHERWSDVDEEVDLNLGAASRTPPLSPPTGGRFKNHKSSTQTSENSNGSGNKNGMGPSDVPRTETLNRQGRRESIWRDAGGDVLFFITGFLFMLLMVVIENIEDHPRVVLFFIVVLGLLWAGIHYSWFGLFGASALLPSFLRGPLGR